MSCAARRGQARAERIRACAATEVEAVAICTLWSTANPRHEQRLRELLAEHFPDAFVSALA